MPLKQVLLAILFAVGLSLGTLHATSADGGVAIPFGYPNSASRPGPTLTSDGGTDWG